MTPSCPELTNCPKKCCDSSSHNSLWAAYLSADSDGVENGCRSSHLGQASIVETCYPNQSSQVAPQQGHSQPGLLTPLTKRSGNHRDQRAVENTGLFDGTCGGNNRHTGSKKPLFISFQPSPQSQSCEIHQHKLAPVETQDAGIQTTVVPARETSDTSTQYSPVQEAAKPIEFLFRAPVDISIQNSATRGQAGCRNEREEQTTPRALLDDHRKETEHTPRSKSSKEPKAWHLPVTSFVKQYPTHNTESRITTWRPKGLSTGAQSKTIDTEMSEQDCGGADERGMTDLVEKGSPMKSLPEERDEAASARKVSRLSEETETLQEIADILLMLKQRKKE
ncbi:uncharacterized protein LOC130110692 [Lampris incognitus]|uniref:uncharacterized protein LOC130110692 n=1 Tax=Lampris incognitus TaxID=2546036 RepID=UPI0024B55216|nr:uncharacterized protein LOC130110692 [Lampris incognitus]